MTTARGRPSRGAGRRPGQGGTRAGILTAALGLFAVKGHSGTTMHGIAQRAEVDPAMIHHFFGNKDGLFREAVSSRIDLSALFGPLTQDTEEEREIRVKNRGNWISRTFLSCRRDQSPCPALVAVHRTILSDEATAKAFGNEIEASFASRLGRIAPEEAERTPTFTSPVSAQPVGLAILRMPSRWSLWPHSTSRN
ncbi:TetR/AcrR family transcriptional regulator [Streptomyces sasae]|uniref:TetR/AcrR family transcriptional regulator n=1 Tax=Streptomyces sasae TaxID=1266772 RepID=UPI00292DAA99|nr:helix-turn-helix domain-containing protein [Streptomyces sasae]